MIAGHAVGAGQAGGRGWAGWILPTLVAAALAGTAQAHPEGDNNRSTASQSLQEGSKGHGTFSVELASTLVNGFRKTDSELEPDLVVRGFNAQFSLDYFLTDHWSVSVGIPYVMNKYVGPPDAHCPTATFPRCAGFPVLKNPRPKDQFLDDGNYHSDWQDWDFGTAWHTRVGDTLLTPALAVTIPSHSYTFFQNAAVGQRIWRVEPSITVAHQFQFTNLYYQLYYGYAIQQRHLGVNTNYHHLYGELGYFLNPKLAVRLFAVGKFGGGLQAGQIGPLTQGLTSDYWYRHDQINTHQYAGIGTGVDWQFSDHYGLSASVQKLLWGRSIFNFRYIAEVRLTRNF